MEKKHIVIDFKYEKDFSPFGDVINVYISNLDDLVQFIYDPKKFIDYEECMNSINYMVFDLYEYAVDKDGNVVDNYDIDEYSNYEHVLKTDEEIQKAEENLVAELDEKYNSILNHNYEIDRINFDSGYMTLEEIRTAINLVKNNVKEINLSCLTLDEITKVLSLIDISDDVKLVTRYNYHDTCNKSELSELTNYLNRIKEYVNRYGLSPLEICIFVNDLIREREFNAVEDEISDYDNLSKEEYNEAFFNSSKSRSLFRIFKSDKIVCAGFSMLYSAILELFDIKSERVSYMPLDEEPFGHMANYVYLDDNQYNVKGIFEIDTTWGRKKDGDNNYDYQKSINNYFHFARPIIEANAIKAHYKLGDNKSKSTIDQLRARINRLNHQIDLGAPDMILSGTLELISHSMEDINAKFKDNLFDKELNIVNDYLNMMINHEKYDIEGLKKVFPFVLRKVYASHLNPIAFKSALYQVKLVEHSIDKDKYPVTVKDLNEAFKSRMDSKETQLLSTIFGTKLFNMKFDNSKKRDIAGAELISVLHKIADDKVNENPVHYIKK